VSCLDYTFKASPRRPAESWHLDGRSLVRAGGAAVCLDTVTGGSFSDMPSGPNWSSSLVIEHAGGTTRIACCDGRDGASRAQYMALVVALLGDLAVVSPDAEFRAGGGRIMTYVLLTIGIVLGLAGVYAMAGAIAGQFAEAKQFALSMGATALIFGIFLAWSGSPWSKPSTRSPQDLLNWLRTWLRQPA